MIFSPRSAPSFGPCRTAAIQAFSACFALVWLALPTVRPVFGQTERPTFSVDPSWYQALTYRMPGPYRGGRVTAVTGVPGPEPVLYMGATGGGVWKSTTHGLQYTNVSDGYFDVGSIGALAVAPSDSNVVYAGTGSACIRSNVSTGRGVYKSLDAAETWMYIGLPEAGQIGSMAVHPTDPNLLYVAALGHPFGPNPERGVYRTYDGGTSWEQILYVSDSTGAASVAINPDQPNEIYATMWRAERKPWTIISGGLEGGLYKSIDGGDTWTQLTDGLPTGLRGKIDVSLSPANPERVYALVEAPADEGGLYRSDNGGASFMQINDQKSLLYRPFYYTHVHADPLDPDVVYVSNEGFFKSEDGGATFENLRTPHGDHHALWINPANTDYLFQGNDGGATVSLDGGDTWSSIENQPTAEMYHVVVDDRHPYWLYGEQQDNTTIAIPSLPPAPTVHPKQHWRVVAGCETGPLAVHPTDPDIVYGGCKGRFSRYNHRTGQTQQYWVYPYFNYGHPASEMPFRFQRTAPIEISPHDPNVIYHASQFVHKTTNEGRNWQVISPDLTAFETSNQGYSGEPITRDITGEEIYSAIYQLRESPLEEGVLWAGSNDGLIHVTRDGGENWVDVTPDSLLPGGRVQTIEPSVHGRGRAFAALYRYMLDDWAPYLFMTQDYGETWTLLSDSASGIPMNYPTRVIREDPNRRGLLYAGTEFGMFVSFDEGASWQPFQLNLPATPVTDIRIHRKDLVLSTMGRSFWIMDDLSPLHQIDPSLADAAYHLFAPRDAYRYRWSASRERFDGSTPEYPQPGLALHYYLAEVPEEEIVLEILDNQGRVLRSFRSDSTASAPSTPPDQNMQAFFRPPTPEVVLPKKEGLNRFYWDMHYQGPQHLDGESLWPDTGPLAEPGPYRIAMRIGDWSATQYVRLLLDPRLAGDGVSPADVEAQVLLALRIRDNITALTQTVQRIREIRQQIGDIQSARDEDNAVSRQTDEITTALTALEDALIQTQAGKVGAQLKPKLLRQLTYLYGMLDAADQTPGEDAYVRIGDIEAELDEHVRTLEILIAEDISALNARLERMGYSPVSVD